jgi:hypothetical protein
MEFALQQDLQRAAEDQQEAADEAARQRLLEQVLA